MTAQLRIHLVTIAPRPASRSPMPTYALRFGSPAAKLGSDTVKTSASMLCVLAPIVGTVQPETSCEPYSGVATSILLLRGPRKAVNSLAVPTQIS